MDVFSKIKNTLSSTVNEIAAALPGNPLLREYDIGKQVGSAGPGYLWKIYDGKKKSTKAEVSIFVFEKKSLDQYARCNREPILESARKGVTQLTKLRHPRVLTVEHAVDESRDSLVFCTEPVFASLGNALGKRLNIIDIPNDLQAYHLYDVEIKYGILQISEGLAFLHGGVKMLHGNLCPEAIIINKQGVWKLAGFDFCILNKNQGGSGEAMFTCPDWDTTLPPCAQANPNFMAPEMITEKRCDFSSDLFSLGALLYSIYYSGKSLLNCTTEDVYRVMPRASDKLRNMSAHELAKVPKEVLEHEQMLIHPDSSVRPDADQMCKLPYFEDIGVVTLQYLDNILQRDNLQKSQFFKGLAQVLPKLPKRVVLQRVLPSLTSEFNNTDMIPFVLPNVLMITEDCSDSEYISLVFPSLIPVFKVQSPVQVLLILLQKMDLLLKKTKKDMVQAHILPMICNSLIAPSLQTQELCLSIIPTFAQRLDFPSMKNSVVPRIKKIILEGGTVSVRINALVCIGKVLPMFDKWYIYEDIYSMLYQVRSREPGVLMAMLGIFQITLSHKKLGITKDVLATKVIPFLVPIIVESNLNLQQFSTFMTVIREMLQRVENDQRTKLEQLSQMNVDDSTASFNKLATKDQNAAVNGNAINSNVDEILKVTKHSSDPAKQPTSGGGSEVVRQHLTLEEKQRLAKSKEQEYRMKKEGQIKPIASFQTAVTTNRINPSKPKDLTSSLLGSSVTLPSNNTPRFSGNGLNTFNQPMQNPMRGGAAMTSSTTSNFAMHSPQVRSMNNARVVSQYGGMHSSATRPASQPVYSGMAGMQGWQTPTPNMGQQKTSLDNLMTMSSQPNNPSMSQFNQRTQVQQYGTPNQNMMANQQRMLNPGAATNTVAFQMANPFLSTTPTIPKTQSTPSNLSKQDLLDLLG